MIKTGGSFTKTALAFGVVVLLALIAPGSVGCVDRASPDGDGQVGLLEEISTISMRSSAFKDGGKIPVKYTADGADVSPPLSWSGAPGTTGEFAIICEDPDAPSGTFTHWVIFGIPGNATGLPEGIQKVQKPDENIVQGRNSFGKIGYNGPAPPPGKPHRYKFHIYALDMRPELPPGITNEDLCTAMTKHVLAEGEITGIYQR